MNRIIRISKRIIYNVSKSIFGLFAPIGVYLAAGGFTAFIAHYFFREIPPDGLLVIGFLSPAFIGLLTIVCLSVWSDAKTQIEEEDKEFLHTLTKNYND